MTRTLRVLLWSGIALVVAVGLTTSTPTSIDAPPIAPRTFLAWLGTSDPSELAFAMARLAALTVAWYVVAVCALTVATDAVRDSRLRKMVHTVTVPVLRRALSGVAGVSMTAGALATDLVPTRAAARRSQRLERVAHTDRGRRR